MTMEPGDRQPKADSARRPPRRRLQRRGDEPPLPQPLTTTAGAVEQPQAPPLDGEPGSGRGCLSMFALVATILIVGTSIVTLLAACATLLAYVNYARLLPQGAVLDISAFQQSSRI